MNKKLFFKIFYLLIIFFLSSYFFILFSYNTIIKNTVFYLADDVRFLASILEKEKVESYALNQGISPTNEYFSSNNGYKYESLIRYHFKDAISFEMSNNSFDTYVPESETKVTDFLQKKYFDFKTFKFFRFLTKENQSYVYDILFGMSLDDDLHAMTYVTLDNINGFYKFIQIKRGVGDLKNLDKFIEYQSLCLDKFRELARETYELKGMHNMRFFSLDTEAYGYFSPNGFAVYLDDNLRFVGSGTLKMDVFVGEDSINYFFFPKKSYEILGKHFFNYIENLRALERANFGSAGPEDNNNSGPEKKNKQIEFEFEYKISSLLGKQGFTELFIKYHIMFSQPEILKFCVAAPLSMFLLENYYYTNAEFFYQDALPYLEEQGLSLVFNKYLPDEIAHEADRREATLKELLLFSRIQKKIEHGGKITAMEIGCEFQHAFRKTEAEFHGFFGPLYHALSGYNGLLYLYKLPDLVAFSISGFSDDDYFTVEKVEQMIKKLIELRKSHPNFGIIWKAWHATYNELVELYKDITGRTLLERAGYPKYLYFLIDCGRFEVARRKVSYGHIFKYFYDLYGKEKNIPVEYLVPLQDSPIVFFLENPLVNVVFSDREFYFEDLNPSYFKYFSSKLKVHPKITQGQHLLYTPEFYFNFNDPNFLLNEKYATYHLIKAGLNGNEQQPRVLDRAGLIRFGLFTRYGTPMKPSVFITDPKIDVDFLLTFSRIEGLYTGKKAVETGNTDKVTPILPLKNTFFIPGLEKKKTNIFLLDAIEKFNTLKKNNIFYKDLSFTRIELRESQKGDILKFIKGDTNSKTSTSLVSKNSDLVFKLVSFFLPIKYLIIGYMNYLYFLISEIFAYLNIYFIHGFQTIKSYFNTNYTRNSIGFLVTGVALGVKYPGPTGYGLGSGISAEFLSELELYRSLGKDIGVPHGLVDYTVLPCEQVLALEKEIICLPYHVRTNRFNPHSFSVQQDIILNEIFELRERLVAFRNSPEFEVCRKMDESHGSFRGDDRERKAIIYRMEKKLVDDINKKKEAYYNYRTPAKGGYGVDTLQRYQYRFNTVRAQLMVRLEQCKRLAAEKQKLELETQQVVTETEQTSVDSTKIKNDGIPLVINNGEQDISAEASNEKLQSKNKSSVVLASVSEENKNSLGIGEILARIAAFFGFTSPKIDLDCAVSDYLNSVNNNVELQFEKNRFVCDFTYENDVYIHLVDSNFSKGFGLALMINAYKNDFLKNNVTFSKEVIDLCQGGDDNHNFVGFNGEVVSPDISEYVNFVPKVKEIDLDDINDNNIFRTIFKNNYDYLDYEFGFPLEYIYKNYKNINVLKIEKKEPLKLRFVINYGGVGSYFINSFPVKEFYYEDRIKELNGIRIDFLRGCGVCSIDKVLVGDYDIVISDSSHMKDNGDFQLLKGNNDGTIKYSKVNSHNSNITYENKELQKLFNYKFTSEKKKMTLAQFLLV